MNYGIPSALFRPRPRGKGINELRICGRALCRKLLAARRKQGYLIPEFRGTSTLF
jgi:hypothetical protein